MLRCPCEIFRPFKFVTTKKISILRYNSILRIPLGCSCYHRRSVFLHLGIKKHFNKRDCEIKKYFFKEQKNFFWTSVFLLKNKVGDKNGKDLENDSIDSHKKSEKSKPSEIDKVFSSEELTDFHKDSTVKNFSDNKSSSILKEPKESLNNIPIFGSIDTLESTGTGLSKKDAILEEDNQSTNDQKIEKIVLETIVLDKEKKNISDVASQKIPGIDSKVLVESSSDDVNSNKSLKQANEKNNVKENKIKEKNEEIKRQEHELDLKANNKQMKLEDPIENNETLRSSEEIKTSNLFLEKAKNILRKTTLTADENERTVKVLNLGPPKENINLNATIRRRQMVDLNRSSTERNFITPVRAMTDFLLKPSDLEGLRKTKRRSPYENDPPITVYWRKDVEAKAIDVWGSKENLLKEILKRDIERRRYQQNLFTVKRRLRDYRREQGRESEFKVEQNGLFGSSGKVVLTAIAINGSNFMFKIVAWLYTGSHSMFSEAIHSLADTINQLILAYGIHKSVQRADSDHPYGYTNMRYVSSLISGVGIFCVGSGLSFYHGFVGLTDPADLPSFYWAYCILAGSLATEGATLLVAFNSIRMGASKTAMSISEYVLRAQDPSVNVVLLEDTAAVIGVAFAGSCMGLSSYYNSPIPDAIGSFLVGGLLACVASFIIYTNVAALVGRSIPQERLDKINAELEADVMIRAIHDVKGIDIGNSLVRYKAEMDFDGGELTRSYLDKQDLNQMLEEVRKMQTIDELEEFMLKHGENIVDMMGGEIDRIELKLRKKHPEIRHCDLEIL